MPDMHRPEHELSRLDQLKMLGVDPNIHSFMLNLQHAYQQFLNSFDPLQRKQMWRAMHLLATDMATVTEGQCPEPDKEIYAQLERE